jgi:ATP-dependent exoDNAse (exonuclease V) alpha subunit
MRIQNSDDSTQFANWLLNVGHDRPSLSRPSPSSISIPPIMVSSSEDDLIHSVYGNMSIHETPPPAHFFKDRAILAPTNDDIRALNAKILALLPGRERVYDSADDCTIEPPGEHDNQNLPVEFLHSLNVSGLPLAHLPLKIGCPVILLCNIDKKRGLCNGTRATVVQMCQRVIHLHLITGDHAGEIALIPRITLTPSLTDIDFAIKLNRRQFPLQLAFAMTINKAQGQTVSRVGIDLQKPVFSHGQLYVALSRATSSSNIKILLPQLTSTPHTPNVVFPEVLLD